MQALTNDNYSEIKLYSVFHNEYKAIEFSSTNKKEPTIELFSGACAVKGNVQVAGHVKRIDNGAAFNA